MFDPAAGDTAAAELASRAVWFDSFITNVDRTARNPNLLYWHKSLYFIDHGAALYFHHNWQNVGQAASTRFSLIRQHVLLARAVAIEEADAALRPLLTRTVLSDILSQVPDSWLSPVPGAETPAEKRAVYVEYFLQRLDAAPNFVEEAMRARAELL
jgi:hypothetical protein